MSAAGASVAEYRAGNTEVPSGFLLKQTVREPPRFLSRLTLEASEVVSEGTRVVGERVALLSRAGSAALDRRTPVSRPNPHPPFTESWRPFSWLVER